MDIKPFSFSPFTNASLEKGGGSQAAFIAFKSDKDNGSPVYTDSDLKTAEEQSYQRGLEEGKAQVKKESGTKISHRIINIRHKAWRFFRDISFND